MSKTLNSIIAIFILVSSSHIHATVIDQGSITYDNVSGLDWLDLTETDYMSKDHVLGQLSGGLFNGWRYASLAEVSDFLANFGLPPSAGHHAFLAPRIDTLVSMVGATIWGMGGSFLGVSGFVADTYSPSESYAMRAYYHDNIETHIQQFTVSNSTVGTIGSWLVKNHVQVPEPTSISLFVIGLAGAGITRRKLLRV